MTALPRQPVSASEPPPWSMLIELTEAAPLLEISERHLRRMVAEDDALRGMAWTLKPPQGGKARTYIDRRYNLRLAPGAIGDSQKVPDLRKLGFNERQVKSAFQRRKAVDALREARRSWSGRMQDWMPVLLKQVESDLGLRVGKSQLYQWDKLYQCPADLPKLADKRGGDRRGARYQEAWEHAKQLLLDPREPSHRDVFRRTRQFAQEQGLPWCGSYTTFMRQLDKHVPPEVRDYHRDRRKWRRQSQPTLAKDYEQWPAGTCWEGDHRQFNFWCLHNGQPIRPWLTAWIDRRSRKVAGWYISPEPNSSTILAALRHGLMELSNMGGPDKVWIDNGKDYESVHFHGQTKRERKRNINRQVKPDETITEGLLNMFQPRIEAHFSIPHNPNGKPLIERWFETLEDFDKSLPTYCGRKPEDKPEGIAKLLHRKVWHKLPRFDHVVARANDHIAGYNATAGLDRDSAHFDQLLEGMSPEQYLLEHCPRHRKLSDPAVLDMLLHQHHKPVRVTRNGVPVVVGGERVHYGQFDAAIMPLKPGAGRKGREVRVAHDPREVTRVMVYDLEWRFICEASSNVRTNAAGASESDLRQALREKRAYERSLKQVKQGRHHEYVTPLEQAGQKRREEGPLQPSPDAPLKLVRTPLDQASEEVDRHRMRQAAGAEHQADQGDYADLLDGGDGAGSLAKLAQRRQAEADLDDLDAPFDFDSGGGAAAFADSLDEDTDVDPLLDGPAPQSQEVDEGEGHLLDDLS